MAMLSTPDNRLRFPNVYPRQEDFWIYAPMRYSHLMPAHAAQGLAYPRLSRCSTQGGGHDQLRLLALYSGVSLCTFVNDSLFVYIGRCDSKLLTRHIRPSMQRAGLGLSLLYEVHIS